MRNSEVFAIARRAIEQTEKLLDGRKLASVQVFGLQDLCSNLQEHADELERLIDDGNKDFFETSPEFLRCIAKGVQTILDKF